MTFPDLAVVCGSVVRGMRRENVCGVSWGLKTSRAGDGEVEEMQNLRDVCVDMVRVMGTG